MTVTVTAAGQNNGGGDGGTGGIGGGFEFGVGDETTLQKRNGGVQQPESESQENSIKNVGQTLEYTEDNDGNEKDEFHGRNSEQRKNAIDQSSSNSEMGAENVNPGRINSKFKFDVRQHQSNSNPAVAEPGLPIQPRKEENDDSQSKSDSEFSHIVNREKWAYREPPPN